VHVEVLLTQTDDLVKARVISPRSRRGGRFCKLGFQRRPEAVESAVEQRGGEVVKRETPATLLQDQTGFFQQA
jgi:hypothetical protein